MIAICNLSSLARDGQKQFPRCSKSNSSNGGDYRPRKSHRGRMNKTNSRAVENALITSSASARERERVRNDSDSDVLSSSISSISRRRVKDQNGARCKVTSGMIDPMQMQLIANAIPADAIAQVATNATMTAIGTAAKITDAAMVTTLAQAFALFAFGGFLSCSETALTTLWPWKIKEIALEEGPTSPFYAVQQNVTRFLTTILIGSTVSSILATALITDVIVKCYGEKAIGIATLGMSFFVLLFCEIAPKSIAVQHALAVGRLVVTPIRLMSNILYPLGRLCTAIVDVIFYLLRIKTTAEPFVSENELKLVLSGAMESGSVEMSEQSMIRNVLDLADTPVREIMTPLVQICGISSDKTLACLEKLWRIQKYTRVIVFEERVDNVVGIVNVLSIIDEDTKLDDQISSIMDRNVYFIPESMPVQNLLSELLRRKSHIAVVVNEHGGTIGLVSLEDCIEEIVGEIYDEHDEDDPMSKVVLKDDSDDETKLPLPRYVTEIVNGGEKENRKVYEIGATADIGEVAEYLEIEIKKNSLYETFGGWVCDIFNRIPKEGESIMLSIPIVQNASAGTLALVASSSSSFSNNSKYMDSDDSEGFDGSDEHRADSKKSDFDLDTEDDVKKLKLRVVVLEADERRVSLMRLAIGESAEREEEKEKKSRREFAAMAR